MSDANVHFWIGYKKVGGKSRCYLMWNERNEDGRRRRGTRYWPGHPTPKLEDLVENMNTPRASSFKEHVAWAKKGGLSEAAWLGKCLERFEQLKSEQRETARNRVERLIREDDQRRERRKRKNWKPRSREPVPFVPWAVNALSRVRVRMERYLKETPPKRLKSISRRLLVFQLEPFVQLHDQLKSFE